MSGNIRCAALLLLLWVSAWPDSRAIRRFPLSAVFTETMITLKWDEQSDVKAYNVYARYDAAGFKKVNPVPIATRPQYSFFWVAENGEKKKVVKGNIITLFVTGLTGDSCIFRKGPCIESDTSVRLSTDYFRGFSKVLTAARCRAIFRAAQSSAKLFATAENISAANFTKLYPRLGRRIDSLYRRHVNPLDEGACVPMSTLASKYLTAKGIPCYRCQGTFITQFHSFNLVVIDSVEYLLDFTADQFLPASAPVFMPRDFCSIDSLGRPTDSPQGTVTGMYAVEKVFQAENISFTQTDQANEYRQMLEDLLRE
jgi:hypothetical protein